MNFLEFIKDKIILTSLLTFGIITMEILLIPCRVDSFIKIYVLIATCVPYMIGILIEYFSKKKFYQNLSNILGDLDEKYLVTEIIETPSFIEGQILKQVLEETNKSMCENVNKYKYMRRRLQRIYRVMDS